MDNSNLKKKKLWIIPLVVGIVIGTIGVIMIIKGLNTEDVPLGAPGWFDARSSESFIIPGAFLAFLGYIFVGVGVTFTVAASSKEPKTIQSLQDGIQQVRDYNGAQSSYYCEYCGSLIDDGICCSSCGAKISKKR